MPQSFYAFAVPFVWIASLEKQKEGLHLIISQVNRIPTESVDPTIKNYHCLIWSRGYMMPTAEVERRPF